MLSTPVLREAHLPSTNESLGPTPGDLLKQVARPDCYGDKARGLLSSKLVLVMRFEPSVYCGCAVSDVCRSTECSVSSLLGLDFCCTAA